MGVGAFPRTGRTVGEAGVPFQMQHLRCPLAIQVEAFMRLGLTFKTRVLGEITAGVRS